MSEETSLLPIEEKQVDFYGDELTAVLVQEGSQLDATIYVPVRPICDYLGLDWSAQRKRMVGDLVLSETIRSVAVTATEAGGRREMVCLPLKFIPGWLFGVNVSRIRPELRDKIARYQRECFDVLWEAFQADALTALGNALPAAPSTAVRELMQIREMGLAIAHMAEQQLALEQRVGTTESRLDQAAVIVADLRRRLGAVERRLGGGAVVTEEQAADVMNRVKALAERMTQHEPGKNHYQGVYSELYRRFGVGSYRAIRQEQYEAVLAFLEDWRKAVLAGNQT